MKLGIVGLPNVGKSTLFNSLTKGAADAANYPFCTIDPNVGIVPVPDERLQRLAALYASRKVTPAVFELSLKTKYVDDPTSGEMYDIIRESLTYDLGRIFSNDLIGQGDFRSAISMASNSWMTRKVGIEKRLDSLTKKLMQSFESLG